MQEEGIYCGMSSGANVFVALKIAESMKKDQNVVTVIVDRRDRYLGEYPMMSSLSNLEVHKA